MHLIACPSCDRQYDVSRHDEGSRVRCVCGEVLTVVHHEAHEPRALRCPGCGAPFAPGSRSCEYCRVEIDPLQMNFSSICPHCRARMTEEARFCMDCGRAIAPQVLVALPEKKDCPRCRGALVSRRIELTALVECSGCQGIWLPVASFEEACRESERRARLGRALAGPPGADARPGRPEFRYLPCLVCDDLMVPRNFGGSSGVILDVCGRHGVWLDAGELPAVLAYIEAGGGRDDDANPGAEFRAAREAAARSAASRGPVRPGAGAALGASTLDTVIAAILDFFLS